MPARHDTVRVRCQAEGGVGEREDHAAMTGTVEIEMLVAQAHRHGGEAVAAGAALDAEQAHEGIGGGQSRHALHGILARRPTGVPARALRLASRRPRPTRCACASMRSTSSRTPSPVRCRGAQHRHLPAAFGARRRRCSMSRRSRAVACGAGQVGLGDDQQVGDLEDAGLDRLHLVAQPRRAGHDAGVGDADDLDLGLARHRRSRRSRCRSPPRRTRRPSPPSSAHRPPRWPREATERMNTSGMRAVLAHAHAVAEHRAAGEGARRVDGDHADAPAAGEQVRRSARAPASTCRRPAAPVMPSTWARPRCARQRGAQRRGAGRSPCSIAADGARHRAGARRPAWPWVSAPV